MKTQIKVTKGETISILGISNEEFMVIAEILKLVNENINEFNADGTWTANAIIHGLSSSDKKTLETICKTI